MTFYRTIFAGVLLLLFAIVAAVGYRTGSQKAEASANEAMRNERIELTRAAKEANAEAERIRSEAIEIVVAAEERQRQAERRADSLEARTARLSAEVTEDGQRALESARVLLEATDSASTMESLVRAHLEDDRLLAESNARLAESNEAEKTALREALDASDSRGDAWEIRALASEHALGLSKMECESCRVEANAFRRAANPGWFEKLRQRAPSMLLTAAGTVLLVALF